MKQTKQQTHWGTAVALITPMLLLSAGVVGRYIQILPDVFGPLYILAWLALIPACVVCGGVLIRRTRRRSHTKLGALFGTVAGIVEVAMGIAAGVAFGVGLAGIKFIPPQT